MLEAGVSPSRGSRGGRGGRSPPLAVASITAATAAAVASIAAATAAPEATATPAETATVATAEAAAVAVAPVVAVALAHLDRGLGFMLLDAYRQETDHVGGKTHAPLHLGDRGRRRVDIEERVVRFAILLDLEGDGLDAPILGLGNLAAAFLDDLGIFLRQRFDLRLRNILARQEDMLVERHGLPFLRCGARPGAKPLLGSLQQSCAERPKGPERVKTRGARLPCALRPRHRAASRSASNRSG